MSIKKMEMPNSNREVSSDEKNLEKKRDFVEESEEKTDGIKEKKGIIGGLKEKIGEVRKQRKEIKEGEEILNKEEKEKREKEREEAKEEIDGLFSEMSNRIKNGEDTISQRQKLFKLGSKSELELAEYAKDKLIDLKKNADDVFPKMIKDLKEDLKNYTSDEYHPDDFDKGKGIFDKKDRHIKELEETYKHTLKKFERDIDDLS